MRRVLFALLLVILPLQSVWAATAGYCLHEQKAASHIGHHAHKHPQTKAERGGEAKSVSSPGVDTDCATCHLGATPLLLGPSVPPQPSRSARPRFVYLKANLSHIPPRPERPDRLLAS
ncbi:hypothetical protein [Niveibacterium terrae]|uniref:hypothetical protein n=1 Tax=Niveibacterium terrae TaxID=3373598 RepID=UPI003A8D9EFA